MATTVAGPSGEITGAPGGIKGYRIGEIAQRLGMTERTIRYYEELGLLDSVKRVEGGRRIYADDDVRRLKFIQKLKMLGLSLQEMHELERLYRREGSNRRVLPRLIELLDAHLATTEDRLHELAALRDEIRSYREHVARRLLADARPGVAGAPGAGPSRPGDNSPLRAASGK